MKQTSAQSASGPTKAAGRPSKRPKTSGISTGRGDAGETALLFGQRVAKTHPQIEAVGCCDELTCAIGVARAASLDPWRRNLLLEVQKDLIQLMADVVCAEPDSGRLATGKIKGLDPRRSRWIDRETAKLEARQDYFPGWALPGENAEAAALELARAVARRTERAVWSARAAGRICLPHVYRYLNRLSDLLWLLARQAS